MFLHGAVFKNILYIISNAIHMIKTNKVYCWINCYGKVVSDGSERFDNKFDLAVAYLEEPQHTM